MATRPPRVPVGPKDPVEPIFPPPPPPPAMLTRASITFHTNDEDKDADSKIDVEVMIDKRLVVASISDEFGHFADHSDSGPFTLLLKHPVSRDQLKKGTVAIGSEAIETWRFNFILDLQFDDGGHLVARADGIEMSEDTSDHSFGIE